MVPPAPSNLIRQDSSALPVLQPFLVVILKYTAKPNLEGSEASIDQSEPINTTNQPTTDTRRRPERKARKVDSYAESDLWEDFNAVFANDDLLDASMPEEKTEVTRKTRQRNKFPVVPSGTRTPSPKKATEQDIKRKKQVVESSDEEVDQPKHRRQTKKAKRSLSKKINEDSSEDDYAKAAAPIETKTTDSTKPNPGGLVEYLESDGPTPNAIHDDAGSSPTSLCYEQPMSPTFDDSDIFPMLRNATTPPKLAINRKSKTTQHAADSSDQPRRSEGHKAPIVEEPDATLKPQGPTSSPASQPLNLDTFGFMPSEANNYQFKYDSPSGRTAAELNKLFNMPPRPKAFPQDLKGKKNFGITTSYTYLGAKPKPKLAQTAVDDMEEADRRRKEQVEEAMQKLDEWDELWGVKEWEE
jgi:hypothetical protein